MTLLHGGSSIPMNGIILDDVRKLVGADEYTYFDPQLVIHINSTFRILNQLGVGTKFSLSGSDDKSTWSAFYTENESVPLDEIISYVGCKVRLIFNPPTGSVLEALKEVTNELETRIAYEGFGNDQ